MGKPKVKADIDALYTENDIQDANYATKDVATKSSNGLMSSTDKTKLDNIDGSSSGTVTSVATGTGLTGGAITSTGTIKANLNSETSLGTLGTTEKLYAVGVDANNKLVVNVPWTDYLLLNDSNLTIETDSTKGVAPYNTSYRYTNLTVDTSKVALTESDLKEGTMICIMLGTSIDSTYRNVRIRFGSTGSWIPLFDTTSILRGSSYLRSSGARIFIYSTSVNSDGAFHMIADTNTTYDAATTTENGLMSSTDKTKLDGIANGANNYTHPSYTAKESGLYKITVDNTGHVSAATEVAKSDITALGIPAQDTTYTTATSSANGLMSSTDKSKLDGINITYGTSDLTAGTSSLATGAIYFVYE